MKRRTTGLLGAGLGLALLATGCGSGSDAASSGGDGNSDKPLAGVPIAVGSKDFDEQLVLGNISKLALEDAGADVTDQINLGGTDAARAALTSGSIDTYWGYTGTAWISFFNKTDPIPDRQKQYQAVADIDLKQNNLVWLEPSEYNNTYGLAFRSEAADELGNPKTLSDFANLVKTQPDKATLCVENEFSSRDDGLPGLEKAYGFDIAADHVTILDTGIVYTAMDKGDPCNFGEVFTTDGRVGALDLTVLKDDKAFFPLYNASPIFPKALMDKYGDELKAIFNPISEALTNPVMTKLNERVSANGERPEAVAKDFLESNKLISS